MRPPEVREPTARPGDRLTKTVVVLVCSPKHNAPAAPRLGKIFELRGVWS